MKFFNHWLSKFKHRQKKKLLEKRRTQLILFRKSKVLNLWMTHVLVNMENERKANQQAHKHGQRLLQKAIASLRENLWHSRELANRLAFWDARKSAQVKQMCFNSWLHEYLPDQRFKS
jgi:hypothetical protein